MFKYIHLKKEEATIKDLLEAENPIIVITKSPQAKTLLDYSYRGQGDIKAYTNWERIKLKYIDQDVLKSNQDAYDNGNYKGVDIKVGTILYVPEEDVVLENYFSRDETVLETNTFSGFIANECKNLFEHSGYKQITGVRNNTLIVSNTSVEVFVWIKALGSGQEEGAWLNVSPLIHFLNTSVAANGGNFTMSLAPVGSKPARNDVFQFKIEDSSVIEQDAQMKWEMLASKLGYHNTKFGDIPFFTTVLQANDLVYIRFENLKKDKQSSSDFFISPQDVANKDWDMIGLIDNIQTSQSPSSIQIVVEGRDLIKTFIDDQTIFFPETIGAEGIFGNKNDDSKLVRRLFGELFSIQPMIGVRLSNILKFIVNQMTTTGLVSNQAFIGYGTDISRVFRLSPKTKNPPTKPLALGGNYRGSFEKARASNLLNTTKDFKKLKPNVSLEPADGVWRVCKFLVDDSALNRYVVDSGLNTMSGAVLNFIRKVVQYPLVEFFTDTYTNKFIGVVRKPPFDYNGQRGLLKNSTGSGTDLQDVSESSPIKGVDYNKGSVTKNFGYDAKAYNEAIDGNGDMTTFILDGVDVGGEGFGKLTLEIQPSLVISDNLSWETEVYSWYMFNPRGNLLGTSTEEALAYIGAVKFDEYVDQWGSRPFEFTSNYSDIFAIPDKNQQKVNSRFYEQVIQDYKYLIDIHAYLPFTRRGTITMQGDRRFRRGLYVYYLPTDEIFYVDSVIQNRTIDGDKIDRTTTLQVSRGMRANYWEKYHNIVETNIEGSITAISDVQRITSKWKVNKSNFDFFIKRQQWSQNKPR